MVRIKAKIKKMGNSYWVLIPKDLVDCEVISADEMVVLELKQQDLNIPIKPFDANAPKVYFDLSYFSTRVLKNMDIATFISYGGFAYA